MAHPLYIQAQVNCATHSTALYGKYTAALNELKRVLQTSVSYLQVKPRHLKGLEMVSGKGAPQVTIWTPEREELIQTKRLLGKSKVDLKGSQLWLCLKPTAENGGNGYQRTQES
jgi:hypothetical protein